MTCSWLTLNFLTTCSCLAHLVLDLLIICSCLVHDLFITCSWRVHDVFMTCSWFSSFKLSITYSCFVNNFFMFWSKLFINYATCSCLVKDLNKTCSLLVIELFFITCSLLHDLVMYYLCFVNNLTKIWSWPDQNYILIMHSFFVLSITTHNIYKTFSQFVYDFFMAPSQNSKFNKTTNLIGYLASAWHSSVPACLFHLPKCIYPWKPM